MQRNLVTFIDVATLFAAAIFIVSPEEIPEVIKTTFKDFRQQYG